MEDLFGFGIELAKLDREVMEICAPRFREIEATETVNTAKVLRSFAQNRVGATHFAPTTGYGYNDEGRDRLDRVFADIVGAPDALCRTHFMSGTHALTVALFGMLKSGDRVLFATGEPYDTLKPVVWAGKGHGSLEDYGVTAEVLPLNDGEVNLQGLKDRAPGASLVYFQRSRGYDPCRRSFSSEELGAMIAVSKEAAPNVPVMVDNCYGEFCDEKEPTDFGADLIVGSLIKNPGGGIAETGGYIAGSVEAIDRCADRLTVPGAGREIGCTPAGLRNQYLGLFLAPQSVANALKSSVYAACLFEKLGFDVSPRWDEPRHDITSIIRFGEEQKLVSFCQAIQAGSPVDSFAVPEGWEMPGYDSRVIMAAGTFTCGSSIELSCDAPLREPFAVYLQGGIQFSAARYAFLSAASKLLKL